MAAGFVALYPGPVREVIEATSTLVSQHCRSHPSIEDDADSLFRSRQTLQTLAIAMHDRDVGPGILTDVDHELAVRYFAIDSHLLDVPLSTH